MTATRLLFTFCLNKTVIHSVTLNIDGETHMAHK